MDIERRPGRRALLLGGLVGPGRRYRSGMTRIRVVPGHRPPHRSGFQRRLRGAIGIHPVCPVERFADFAADQHTENGAGRGRRQLAPAAADLRAQKAAGDTAEDGAAGLFLAVPVVLARGQGYNQSSGDEY